MHLHLDEKTRPLLIAINVIFFMVLFYLIVGQNYYSKEPPDLTTYAISVFAGYLFFFILPVELIFIFFASSQDHHLALLVIMTVTLAMVSQSIDYTIGRLASQSFIKKLISKKKYDRSKKFLAQYGHFVIFIFNVLPLSSPILSLTAGVLHYSFRQVLIYSFLGLSIKYTVAGIFLSE